MNRHSSFLISPCRSCFIQEIGYFLVFLHHHLLSCWLWERGIKPLNLLSYFLSYPLGVQTFLIHGAFWDASREAEVTDLHTARTVDQNVCTLEVTMHDVALVDKAKGAQQIVNYFKHVGFLKINTLFHNLVQICFHVIQNKAE